MKNIFRIMVCICSVLLVLPAYKVYAVSTSAEAAVLLCAETGEVLYEKNRDRRMPMASTTKIMTALLLLEAGTPDREVVVTPEMAMVEGTSMGLLPGDRVTYRALCAGMLLSSGNDAANTAAISVAGSAEAFADRMNRKAHEIGMRNTHFVTPSGLDDPEHYSTAYDMALLGAEAVQNVQFSAVCSAKSISMAYGNPPYRRTLTNHNRLLKSYPDCIGVKTGFTKKSGRCLVSAARRNGVTLVAVTLRAPDDWQDHTAMLDYGFFRVQTKPLENPIAGKVLPVTGGTRESVPLVLSAEPTAVCKSGEGAVTATVYIKPFLFAPVSKGAIVGQVVYTCDDRTVCTRDILTAESLSEREIPPAKPEPETGRLHHWMEKIKGVF